MVDFCDRDDEPLDSSATENVILEKLFSHKTPMSKKKHKRFMAVSMGMRGLTLLVRNQGLTLLYLETSYIVPFLFLWRCR